MAQEVKTTTSDTQADRENKIFSKVKELARGKRYGTLSMRAVIHDGFVTEIRHRDFEGIIRA